MKSTQRSMEGKHVFTFFVYPTVAVVDLEVKT